MDPYLLVHRDCPAEADYPAGRVMAGRPTRIKSVSKIPDMVCHVV
jgi:hypothetical protein